MLSKAFRVVDAETRQEVRNKRIQQLEADNYGDDVDALAAGDDDAYQDSDDEEASVAQKKKKKTAKKGTAIGGVKRPVRKLRSLEKIIMEQGYQYYLDGPVSTKNSRGSSSSSNSSSRKRGTDADWHDDTDDDADNAMHVDVDDDSNAAVSGKGAPIGKRKRASMGQPKNPRNKINGNSTRHPSLFVALRTLPPIPHPSFTPPSLTASPSLSPLSSPPLILLRLYPPHLLPSTNLADDDVEIVDGPFVYPNYLSVAAAPSTRPPRHFCSVCGFIGQYSCTRCGMRYCSLKCNANHKETRCLKYGNF